MNIFRCLSFQSTILLWGVLCFGVEAQESQQPLTPGVYVFNSVETPLHYIPKSLFLSYNQRSALYIQTTSFKQLQSWGTRFAIVTRDTISGTHRNSITFLNEVPNSSMALGFLSQQTEPIYFMESAGTMQLLPTYGHNPLERSQNGIFNLQDNWFSLYRSPHVEATPRTDLSDEGKTLWGTTLTVESAAFNLFNPIMFERVIYSDHADSIPLYKQADSFEVPVAWAQRNESLFVLKDSLNGLWLQVSRFRMVPEQRVRLTSEGKKQHVPSRLEETRAWMLVEDQYRGHWVAHEEELPDYRFEVVGASPDQDGYSHRRGQLLAIKVIDKHSGRVLQIINNISAEISQNLTHSLTFLDANFDGYPDIMSDFTDGGAGPNYINIFFLFNPGTHRFEYDDTLSGLPQVEVDVENQLIHSRWRSGAGQHGAAAYRFVDGRLLQTYQWDQTWGSFGGDVAKQVESVLQEDGSWDERVRYWIENIQDTLFVYSEPHVDVQPLDMLLGTGLSFNIQEEKEDWYYIEIDEPKAIEGWVLKSELFPDLYD